jgi:hypothetical protein
VSKLVVNGADVTVAIVVQFPAPAGERSNTTDETVRPTGTLGVAVNVIVPLTDGPGSVSTTVGGVFAISSVTALDAVWSAVESVTTARRRYVPSATAVLSKVAV